MKYDPDGTELWVRRYDGPGHSYDVARALAVDGAGNAYVTGEVIGDGTFHDYATIKYSSGGVEEWAVTYDGPGDDEAVDIALGNDGSVYVGGDSCRIEGSTCVEKRWHTVKYGSGGSRQWVAVYGGESATWYEEARVIAVGADGGIYVTGQSEGAGDYSDYTTVKYDSNGAEAWVARWDSESGYGDSPYAMALDGQSNVYVTGLGHGPLAETEEDYVTVKFSQIHPPPSVA